MILKEDCLSQRNNYF